MRGIRSSQVCALVLTPVAAVAISLGIGTIPTRTLGGRDALIAMLVAGGLSTLATILGSIPVIWAMKRSPKRVPTAALGATLLRVIVLVALVVPVGAYSGLPLRALLLWVAIAYVCALAGETVVLALSMRHMGTPE